MDELIDICKRNQYDLTIDGIDILIMGEETKPAGES